MSMLRTEYEFQLPLGFVDEEGQLHRDGVMRLATAADEILPLRDRRVRSNEAYLTIIVLSRVITRLGGVDRITPAVIEGLFAADLGFLQEFYNRINAPPGTNEEEEHDDPGVMNARGRAAEAEREDASGRATDVWRASPLETVSLGGSPATP